MRTRVEEWNCSVDVKEEVIPDDILPLYTFMQQSNRHNAQSIKRRYTFHFRYWKENEIFKNMAYSFEALGYVDWDDFKANSPVGMIKFKDLMNFTKKNVSYKLLNVQRSNYR